MGLCSVSALVMAVEEVMKKWKWQASLRLLSVTTHFTHSSMLTLVFYVIAFSWMQESTTSVWFDHSSIPQRRYRREGDFAQQGWAGASQQRALGSDRHRASQTAAINSLTVYAAKALRTARLGRRVSAERTWK